MATSLAPLEDHLTCSVCLDIYTDPHALKCLHTYCYKCIKGLRDNSGNNCILCPDCRKVTAFNNIQKNFATQSLVDLHKKSAAVEKSGKNKGQTLCDVCDKFEKIIKSFCIDCSEFLCTDCHMAHQGSKTSRDHRLRPIEEHCQPKQEEVRAEIEKFETEQEDIGWKQKKNAEIIKKIQQSFKKQVKEIYDSKQAIISRAEMYHSKLLQRLTCINESLVDTLQQHEGLFDQGRKQLERRIKELTELSKSGDYCQLTEILETLSEDTDKELEHLRMSLPEVDPQLKCPTNVQTVRDWNPEDYIQMILEPETMPENKGAMQIHPQYHQVKSVDIDCWPRKLCVLDNKLWVAGGYKGVYVYNTNCDQLRHFQCKQFGVITGIAKTPNTSNGDVIVCGRATGIHQISQEGDYLLKVCDGNISDVSSSEHTLYALDYKKCKVLIFTYKAEEQNWIKQKEFSLQYSIGHMSDKLCVTKACLYVSSFYNHTTYVYSLSGEYWLQTGGFGVGDLGRFRNPHLCDWSSPARVLVCDWRNHRLQALDTVAMEWEKVDLGGGLRYPVSAGVGLNALWVGSVPSLFGPRKLLKFEKAQ